MKYWLLGSIWGSGNKTMESLDKTQEFINNGYWEIGYDEKYKTELENIQIGDLVALKSTYVRKNNLSFETYDQSVSCLMIKAIGVVTENKDKNQIKIDWNNDFTEKEIYHFFPSKTIQEIIPNSDKNKRLIEYVFKNKNQDNIEIDASAKYVEQQNYKKLIKNYKNYLIKNGNSEEIYKWELVKKFQKITSRNDFFDNIFENIKKLDFSNLISWRKNIYKYPERFFKNEDFLIENITLLFNEQKNIKERTELFLEHVNTFLNQKDIFQDYRTISVFLAFQFPKKYFIYKPSLYNKFVKIFNITPKKTNEKYFHYQELLSEFTEKYIKSDNELLELVKKELNENCYADENHTILAQDILYYNFEKMNNKKSNEESNEESKINEDIKNKTDKNMKKLPLNKILYGPPGTGKTYNTINKTIEILDNNFYIENQKLTNEKEIRNNLKNRFEELKNSKQIEFVTFHQSYGYEDFVEGLKAETTDEENVSYRVGSGIFKKLCERAELNYKQQSEILFVNFDDLISQFASEQVSLIEKKKYLELEAGTANISRVNFDKDNFPKSFSTGGGVKDQSLTVNIIRRDYDDFKKGIISSYRDILPSQESKSSFHGNARYYWGLYEKIKEFEETFKKNLESKKIIEKKYIIIIDEINRGNISKIFGELITLIEDSKRMGNDEAVEITLPNSHNKFSVPNNLYILGTMNTADKSIALLDTALRRRFEFEEMMPQPELLSENIEGINLQKLLTSINNRIEYFYDRDHCIGHAYLINAKNLKDLQIIFSTKIIPLLQEYFYDDWEKINIILGDNGFIIKKPKFTTSHIFNIQLPDEFLLEEDKKFFEVINSENWNAESFIKIYKENSEK